MSRWLLSWEHLVVARHPVGQDVVDASRFDGGVSAAVDALRAALADKDVDVRLAAVETLGGLNGVRMASLTRATEGLVAALAETRTSTSALPRSKCSASWRGASRTLRPRLARSSMPSPIPTRGSAR